MLKNYFKIAYRSLLKHKLFAFINILGLGLALPFAFIALMQVQSTYESDNFHPYPSQTFRIISNVTPKNGSNAKYASTPFRLAKKLKDDYPFIVNATKVVRQFDWELSNKIKTLQVNSIFVEPAFFEMFGFKIELGSIPIEPNSVVITAEKAKAFFGDVDPLGKILTHPRYGDLKITGVLLPFKRNTHFRTDIMVSLTTLDQVKNITVKMDDWYGYEEAFTYVHLDPTSDVKKLQAALSAMVPALYPDASKDREVVSFSTQSLRNISPDSQNLKNNPYVEDILDLGINFMFAIILLILAGFNYTNLTLAKSLSRAKEVGIRKVSGARRGQLVMQFICEAVLIGGLALILGFFILQWMREYVHVTWFTWEVDQLWILGVLCIGFTIITGAIAGAVPAWLLSGLQPVAVLKGVLNPISIGKMGFRKSLVVIQFVVTVCFVFIVGHMVHQFNFMATDNINFNRKNIFNISLADDKFKNLVNDIKSYKQVARVGLTSTPFGYNAMSGGIKKDLQSEFLASYYYSADADFVPNMNLKLLAGFNLPDLATDSADRRVLINEQAAFALGWSDPQDALGKAFYFNTGPPLVVHGVVKDFCYADYQYGLNPLIIQYNPSQFKMASVLLHTPYVKDEVVSNLRKTWHTHYPYGDLAYTWYEQEMYDRYYPRADMRFLGLVCGIIFFIAIMGLLGMVIYTTEKRVREIGIRKVIGASVKDIVNELSSSFIKLLMIAALIAIPIGYISGIFLMSVFTFHDGVSIWMMTIVVVAIFSIALATIVINAARAANNNPVHSLRAE